jgi:XRE family transcriptional regulator, fatty acid utilization regulator
MASALKWWLSVLGRISAESARAIPASALRHNGRNADPRGPPPLFSRPFMEVLALDKGRVSAGRAARLLDLTVEDLADASAAQGVTPPFEP